MVFLVEIKILYFKFYSYLLCFLVNNCSISSMLDICGGNLYHKWLLHQYYSIEQYSLRCNFKQISDTILNKYLILLSIGIHIQMYNPIALVPNYGYIDYLLLRRDRIQRQHMNIYFHNVGPLNSIKVSLWLRRFVLTQWLHYSLAL